MNTLHTYTITGILGASLIVASAGAMDRSTQIMQANQDLINAAYQGNAAAVTNALHRGANINYYGQQTVCNNTSLVLQVRHTPLYFASQQGHSAIVSMLIEAGADVRLGANNASTTPLHAAIQGVKQGAQSHSDNRKSIIQMLIHHGADLYTPDAMEKTPLAYLNASDDTQKDSATDEIIGWYNARQRRPYGQLLCGCIGISVIYACSRVAYAWYTGEVNSTEAEHDHTDTYKKNAADENNTGGLDS